MATQKPIPSEHRSAFREIPMVVFMVLAICSTSVLAQDNIEAAVDRYLKQVSPSKMLDDSYNEMVKEQPQEARAYFVAQMNRLVRVDRVELIIREALIKTFTVEEINALADFYESKHGSSILRKFGIYNAQVTPAIQAEIKRGLGILAEVERRQNIEQKK